MTEGNGTANVSMDVAIIGAGFSGLYALYRLRKMGLKCRIFDKAGGVGGTWYWNRYPGCGSDIESLEYSFGFDDELQQEFKWERRYASQPELESYANHIADRYDLRPDIQLNTNIEQVLWNEADQRWNLTLGDGSTVEAQYCVMATGLLSAPKPVGIPGVQDFKGETIYTSSWPKDKPDFAGKRVGVVGTGSSAIQAIPFIAKEAGELFVFQRTAHFCVPLRNEPLKPDYEARVKAMYPEWREKQMNSFGGYISVDYQPRDQEMRKAMEVSPEEREAEFQYRWDSGGLCFYTSFLDLLFDRNANEALAEFVRKRVRTRINDPKVADKLLPTDYPILTKRLACDTDYFETYNESHVHLIDVNEIPITRITEKGILVGDEEVELDVIIYATGFDAVTGAITNIDIRGRDGLRIKDAWADGARTYAGLMTGGFPNMFMVNGPQSCTGFFNPILNAEYQMEWFAALIDAMKADGNAVAEATDPACTEWTEHLIEVAKPTLFWDSANWYIGANVPGKPRVMMLYLGGFGAYKEYTKNIVSEGYKGITFQSAKQPVTA